MRTLRQLGFAGSDAQVLSSAHKQAPALLASCCSASAMWAANSATVSPSADTLDARVHFTPANLISQLHRSLESAMTGRLLKAIFPSDTYFAHHPPLPPAAVMADEGAANHLRLAAAFDSPGLEIFVYGKQSSAIELNTTTRFPARQTMEASHAVARCHGLTRTIVAQQNPAAIDAGAFHNDVVAVSHLNVLIYHPDAWAKSATVINDIRRLARSSGIELVTIEINRKLVPLAEAVSSYLFNSQIVSLPDGSMTLIAPAECRRSPGAKRFLDWLPTSGTPITKIRYVQVRQSMRNGGGPACLRLRVALNAQELAAAHPGVFLTPALYERLIAWVQRHYRDTLTPNDLADPKLLDESRRALDELSALLSLGSIYDFQKV
jgi:succinylarginine dihydrolase